MRLWVPKQQAQQRQLSACQRNGFEVLIKERREAR
jgi:hypothetical protein